MNIYLNLKDFTNKMELIQAIKIFNSNHKDVNFTINAAKEDTIILNKSPNYIICDSNTKEVFSSYKDYDYVIVKSNLPEIKEIVFDNNEKDFLNLSFYLKDSKFRNYIFEFNNKSCEKDIVEPIKKAIEAVKKEKSLDKISVAVLKETKHYDFILSSFKDADIKELGIEEFLTSKFDLIITDTYLSYIIKSTFIAIDRFQEQKQESEKKGGGFTSRLFKSSSTPTYNSVSQFLSKYSYIYKDNTTFVNINYEMTINEFLAILVNTTN